MLIIEVKDTESIDRALKRYKRKVQNVRLIQELRRRKEFVKPSVQRRNQILKAVYRTKKQGDEELLGLGDSPLPPIFNLPIVFSKSIWPAWSTVE